MGLQIDILTEMIVALGAPLDSIVDLLIFPKIVMKNIANMHRKHDVCAFSKHCLNIASLKHCIAKKSENQPLLPGIQPDN